MLVFAVPTTNSRSVGTKICLWSDPSNVDYAIGNELDSIWFSVPTTTQGFCWYAGTTRIARLSGLGTFDAKGLSTTGNIYSGGNTNQVGAFFIGTGGGFGNGRVNITNAASTKLCDFRNANAVTQVGSISTSGLTTTYNSMSDHRLKENDKLIKHSSEKVLQRKPCNF